MDLDEALGEVEEEDDITLSKYKKGNFFGVYMLHCLNPKYKAKVYIGFTTNPKRRLMQHNKGKWAGGAKKTNCKGPWEMVVIVHQFPNKISALAFEWAWQHPEKSRRMRNFEQRRFRESQFNYYCRALQELLSVGPWNKLPLEMSWLNDDYMKNIIDRVPKHMPWQVNTATFSLNLSGKTYKNYEKINTKRGQVFISEQYIMCPLCMNIIIRNEKMLCINKKCEQVFHITCLAECFSEEGSLLPVEGTCPNCKEKMLWGDLVRNRENLLKQFLPEIM
ncbi:structure-specific endonuclease subunit SLX1 [Lycorma delicatula]|uniref:structure-specific endonuclease subunit SLX1 n=1 Tax=Lycorma delicatula TaxID=130591 RepID=UPI003F5122E3